MRERERERERGREREVVKQMSSSELTVLPNRKARLSDLKVEHFLSRRAVSGSWFHRIAPAWLMRLAEDAVGETGMMSNLLLPPRVRREGLRVKKLANRVLEDLFRQR